MEPSLVRRDGDFWILYLQSCAGVAQGECVANVPLLAYRPTGFHQLQRIVATASVPLVPVLLLPPMWRHWACVFRQWHCRQRCHSLY